MQKISGDKPVLYESIKKKMNVNHQLGTTVDKMFSLKKRVGTLTHFQFTRYHTNKIRDSNSVNNS